MKGLFKGFRARRENKRSLFRLGEISSLFATIERLAEKGLIHWDRRRRRLFIAESLAVLMLARGAEGWSAFLNNVYLWLVHADLANQWHSVVVKRQGRAVAEARKARPDLSAADVRRIRHEVEASLAETDVPLPTIKEFEFYVLTNASERSADNVLCGVYNPDTDALDLVLWDDVKRAVRSEAR